MLINGSIERPDEPVPFQVRRYDREGRLTRVSADVQEETLLSVYVDGAFFVRLNCSANHLEELVVGSLFTAGRISSADEVASIEIGVRGTRADVWLRDCAASCSAKASGVVPACSTHLASSGCLAGVEGMEPVEPVAWTTDEVFAMMDAFALDHAAHCRTRGTHSAYLWRRGELLCRSEDIGRHNAFDKAIGFAFVEGVDLRECALFTSGRVPTDMVAKAIRSRVPILVSKAVATDKTVEIARAFRLTLICNARNGSIEVFNDPCMDGRASRLTA